MLLSPFYNGDMWVNKIELPQFNVHVRHACTSVSRAQGQGIRVNKENRVSDFHLTGAAP